MAAASTRDVAQFRRGKILDLMRDIHETRQLQMAARHEAVQLVGDDFRANRRLHKKLKELFGNAGRFLPASFDPATLIGACDTPAVRAFVTASWQQLVDHEQARVVALVRKAVTGHDASVLDIRTGMTLGMIGKVCAELVPPRPTSTEVLLAWRKAQTLRALVTGELPEDLGDMAAINDPTAAGFQRELSISSGTAQTIVDDLGPAVSRCVPNLVEFSGDHAGRLGLPQFAVYHPWFAIATRESNQVVMDLSYVDTIDPDVFSYLAVAMDEATRGFVFDDPALIIVGLRPGTEMAVETGFRMPVRYVESFNELISAPAPALEQSQE